jgi:hypothetical protein
MALRKISCRPDEYEFRTNYTYRAPWGFLPHKERAKVIASQLTYLDFHEWLMDKLRHTDRPEPDEDDWSPLVFDVAEGFYKTDVLYYASICEAALFSVLQKVQIVEGSSAHQSVKDCFERTEDRFLKLYGQAFETRTPAGPHRGQLALHYTRSIALKDSDVKFAALIKAGQDVGIYDAMLRKRLDRLRDDRNCIHLANQVRRTGCFSRQDRIRAKNTTENLRSALKEFVSQQTWS